ncbi:MAG: cache domain-containing protein [Thermodesulfobacteriota bacterium]
MKTIFPPLLTAILFVVVVYQVFLPSLEAALLERKREMVHELTETAWHILQTYDALAERGEIAPAEARQKAIRQIREIRYGDDHKSYFWINDMRPVMVMHPYRTDLEGKALANFVDPAGNALFKQIVATVVAQQEGYVDYMWQRQDDPTRIVPKISFVKAFQPWGWIIGTGIYLDDVQQEIKTISRRIAAFSGLIFATVLLLGGFMVNHGLRTARKKRAAEEALTRSHADLERLVEERTKGLEEANRLLQHEIRVRTEAEAAYSESEKKYRTLYQAANDAIVLLDGFRFAACNPKTLEIFRCPEKDLLSRDFFAFSPERQPDGRPSRQLMAEKCDQALAGTPQFFEWRCRTDATPEIDTEISLNRVELGGGIRLLAIIRDISRRKFMEQEVQNARNIESLGVLAGGIAHDFNNLLTAIVGNISLARLQSGDCPAIDALLAKTENACKRASSLARQLLTFAKGGTPVKEVTQVAGLIREVCAFALCGAKTACRFELAADLLPVSIDRGQISRLLQNLIINALQAMPEGGEIVVSAGNIAAATAGTAELKNDAAVRISVRDNGPGIAPELQTRIFTPYFTTREGGSGLGLAIAYSIAKKHGGALTVDSAPGKGTVFHLMLPAAAQPVTAPTAENTALYRGSGKILIMDDETIVREVAAEMVKALGYTPESACDGRVAVELYKQAWAAGAPYTAVILDLTVPGGMGGSEALAELLAIDPQVRAVVSSGYADDDAMANYRRYGFRAVIPKPYTLEHFAAVFRSLMK